MDLSWIWIHNAAFNINKTRTYGNSYQFYLVKGFILNVSSHAYDVRLDGVGASETSLTLLILQDEKGTTKLVKGQLTH